MAAVAAVAALLVALLFGAAPALAQAPQPVPPLDARVIDRSATLTDGQRAALEAKLADFEQQAGPQIVVLLVPTTAPEDIVGYAQRVGEAWKIGRREVGDGLLLVIAKDDRAVRIAPAKALEGAVPDLAARQIIDRQMLPAFRSGDFAGGLNAGIDALMARIRGEHLPAPAPRGAGTRGPAGGFDLGGLGLLFFAGVPIVGGMLSGLLGRRFGAALTAGGAGALAWWLGAGLAVAAVAAVIALVMVGVLGVGGGARGHRRGGLRGMAPPIVWGGGGGGWGGGGFSGGGGGFSSGGGGDFGGGGASGRW